ncbi:MAG: hypothetical protein NXH73_01655 [Flavobacteriaceae bacterium]|nr:hypothetical protein [Flavobacteriaceae bacterium]
MDALKLKTIIKKSLETNDTQLFIKMVEVIECYNQNTSSSVLSKAQLTELDKRRENYLSGIGNSYSWNQVKEELIEKYGLQP